MINLELYIEGQRVDTFKDETVTFTSNIKSTKKVESVLADFSQQFNLPASKINNNIFKHFYNFDIITGDFDARYKVDAFIKLNGIGFRKGTLRLNKVEMRNGKAFSYKVVFFGSTVKLKTLIGKDKLPQLTYLDRFVHDFDPATVRDGFEEGLGFSAATSATTGTLVRSTDRDIIYPLIAHTKQFFFDNDDSTTETDNYKNLCRSGTGVDTTRGINYTDLKPAIKLIRIIEAIEHRYGIKFSRDFFGTNNFQSLYMWLHRDKGGVKASGDELISKILNRDDFVFVNGTDLLADELITYWTGSYLGAAMDRVQFRFRYTITPVGGGTYDAVIKDTISGDILKTESELSGANTIEYIASSFSPREWDPQIIITTPPGGDGITGFDIDFKINRFTSYSSPVDSAVGNYSTDTTLSIISDLYPTQQIPDMGVLDFIKSIFSMFNLTAYVSETDFNDDTIIVKTLDEFYRTGKQIDITEYIKFDKHQVERLLPYSSIKYQYEKPSTLLINKRNDLVGSEFGNLDYVGETDNFDGGKYEIKLKFEHMMFERLKNLGASSFLSNVQWGWFVDEEQAPAKGAPLIFINNPRDYADIAFVGYSGTVTTYNSPSNNLALGIEENVYGINFNEEIDEYNLLANPNSLFNIYHSGYILDIFNKNARKITMEAVLPPSVLLNYNLNDVFIINNRPYRIEAIKMNLMNGESKLTLNNIVPARVQILTEDTEDTEQTPIVVSVSAYDVYNNLITVTYDDTVLTSPIQYVVDGVSYTSYSTSSPLTFIFPKTVTGAIVHTIYLTDGTNITQTESFWT